MAELPVDQPKVSEMMTVGIKPLEWEELQTVPGKFVATTIIGRYERWGINWRLGNSMIQQTDSPEAAAKACQSDLDRIIRSALIGIPQPQATTVRVTDDMVDAALNASWGEGWRPIWSFINDEHPHALMTTALVARFDNEAGEWIVGVAESYMIGKEPASVPRWTHWRYLPPMPGTTPPPAPTSERVQALEEAEAALMDGWSQDMSLPEALRAIRALKATP